MESQEDESRGLYTDPMNPPSLSYPNSIPHVVDRNLDTKQKIISSGNEEIGVYGDLKSTEKNENKDVNVFIMSQFNKFLSYENGDKTKIEKTEENCENKDFSFNVVSHFDDGMRCENDKEKESEINHEIGINDLESHPMVLELLNSTSDEDVCDEEEEDEINFRVLKIANDCGMDSDSGLNIISSDENKGMCNSENLSNITGLETGYDDDSYHLEGSSTGLRGSSEDDSYTQLDRVSPTQQTMFDFNMDDLKEKRTKYFNYGLNELEWEKHCKQMKNDMKVVAMLASSSNNSYQQTENSCAKTNALNGNSQNKVAGDSYEQPRIPIGNVIQVKIGIAERFPSTETMIPRMSNSDTVIEIILHDSKNNGNAENKQICSFQSASSFRNIHVNKIRPFPLDCPYQFPPVYKQLDFSFGKKRVEEGIRTGPRNLYRSGFKRPMLTYPARNATVKNRISELILKYGKDNSKDNHKYNKVHAKRNNEVHRWNKDRIETAKRATINNRYGSYTSGPRKSVCEGVSKTSNNVHLKNNEKNQSKATYNGKMLYMGDSRSDYDSEGTIEEGEITTTEKRGSKRKYIGCQINYRQKEGFTENFSQKARKRPF